MSPFCWLERQPLIPGTHRNSTIAGLSRAVCFFIAITFVAMHAGTWTIASGTEVSTVPAQLGLGFSILTLSRGSGVPEPARQALQRAREIASRLRDQNVSVNVHEVPIGLEGERQLCLTFENAPDAARAWRQIAAVAGGVDLVNLDPRPCQD